MGKKEPKLTAKQARFVKEYIVDFNATQAAIRAGYSKKSAYRIGAELLQKTQVAKAVKDETAKVSEKLTVTIQDVVNKMLELWSCTSKKIPLLDKEGCAVFDEKGEPIYVMVDSKTAAKAVELLGKHVGAFEADNTQSLKGGLKIVWGGSND